MRARKNEQTNADGQCDLGFGARSPGAAAFRVGPEAGGGAGALYIPERHLPSGESTLKSLSLTFRLCSLWRLLCPHDPSLGRGAPLGPSPPGNTALAGAHWRGRGSRRSRGLGEPGGLRPVEVLISEHLT